MSEEVEYLRRNKHIFKATGIEKELDIPSGCLSKAVAGNQRLAEHHLIVLRHWLKVSLVSNLNRIPENNNNWF